MDDPTRVALDVPGVKFASFHRRDETPWSGVVYDSITGQEYDVRSLRVGWNVNDDHGNNHFGFTLRRALARARAANREGVPR